MDPVGPVGPVGPVTVGPNAIKSITVPIADVPNKAYKAEVAGTGVLYSKLPFL